jgi:hypothetical protein
MLEWAWIETAQKIQLDKIFDGMEEENVKNEDLQKIYENYVWWEWDGEPIPEDGSVTFNKELIVSSQDFAKKFNSLIPTPEDTEETPEEEWNWGFDKSVEKKWDRMDQNRVDKINAFAWENAFLDLKGDNLSYNLDNVKKFLWTINDDNFNKDFIKVWTDSRYTWLAATQILLNQNLDGDNKLTVDGEYKRWGETYNAVLDFQKNYNSEHSNDEWFVSLKEDGMPGPKTLSKMLWFVAEADNNSSDSDTDVVDESLNGASWVIEWVWKFENWEFKFGDSVEQWDDESWHYAIIWWEKYYESNDSMNGLWYFSGVTADNQWYFYIWNIKDGKCWWLWTMTWTSWEKYVWNWENNRRSWDWTLTFSNWNEYIWEFNDGSATKWLLTLKSQDWAIMSFNVERDDSWLRITSGDNEGKYIDPKSRDITDTPSD